MSGKFLVYKTRSGKSSGYDMSSLVCGDVTWTGRKGSAARSLSLTLLDDKEHGNSRSGIDVAKGDQCRYLWDGEEIFRGVIKKQSSSEKLTMSITAYDSAIYLANNKDSYSFKKKSATAIFKSICKRYGIKTGTVADTKHVLKKLNKPNTTAWDALQDALSQSYKATGERYYIYSMKGKLHLLKRREAVKKWVIAYGENMTSYTYDKSTENTKTRVKLLSDSGKVLASGKDAALEKLIGTFQDVEQVSGKKNKAQLKKILDSTLKERKKIDKSLNISAIGIPDVYSGAAIYVKLGPLNIKRVFYVDEDSHTFSGNKHTMDLKLNFASNIQAAENVDE